MHGLRSLVVALLILLSAAFLVPSHALAGQFVNNDDGTVSDSLTGLMWQQSDDGSKRTWEEAISYCESLSLAGNNDWRMPDYRELESIIDYARYDPAIDPVFSAFSDWYWSSTSDAVNSGSAWISYFYDGGTGYWKPKSNTYYVRCSREGKALESAKLSVKKTGTGTGTVTSLPAGINCGQTCISKFQTGTQVILSAAADAGSVFDGWSGGGCSGTGTCTVVLSGDVSVTAAFATRGVYSISGLVKTKAGAPMPGVTVALSGSATKSAVTDSRGNYKFSNLSNGAHTLTPAKDQYTFEPSKRSVNIHGSDVAGQDFVGTLQTGSLIVTVTPQSAVYAGAQWAVDNGSWNKSGVTVSGLAVGAHTVSFKDIPGWSTPANQTISIAKNKTTALNVKYTPASVQYTLTVSKTGAGEGRVTSSPAGIDCGTDCTEPYNGGQVVTLTAAAGAGSTFTGWSGTACTGTSPCTVTMNASTTVTADFSMEQAMPDLVIVNVAGPSTGTVGQSIRIFGTVKNQGTGMADAFKTGLYLSKDMTITREDQRLATIDQWEMGPGDGNDFSKEVVLSTTIKAGTYYIGAIADVAGTVAESSEANNSTAYAKPIKVVAPKADLLVQDISLTVDTASVGDVVDVYTTIANHGQMTAGTFRVELYLSKDSSIKVSDIFLRGYDLKGLKAGAKIRTPTQVTIPKNVPPGEYYFGAIADTSNTVNEGDEGNNAQSSIKTILITK